MCQTFQTQRAVWGSPAPVGPLAYGHGPLGHCGTESTPCPRVREAGPARDTRGRGTRSPGGTPGIITEIAIPDRYSLHPVFHRRCDTKTQCKHASAAKTKKPIYVTDIRPGFVDTDMAKGEGQFWVATKEKAAKQIFGIIKQKKGIGYVTKRWWIIAKLLRLIPNRIYKKM